MNRILVDVDEGVDMLIEVVRDVRDRLQSDAIRTVLDHFGVPVRLRPDSVVAGCCTVAGTYFHDPPRIAVAVSPTPRRIAFTVLHELAHHLIRRSYAFTSLARSPEKEERVCDRFAAEILVPAALVSEVVTSGQPKAVELAELYRRSRGSGAVCIRSAADHVANPGYLVVVVENTITYAVNVGMLLDLERNVTQPPDSLFMVASVAGSASGTTQLLCRPGHLTGPLRGDVAVGLDRLTLGVFVGDVQ